MVKLNYSMTVLRNPKTFIVSASLPYRSAPTGHL